MVCAAVRFANGALGVIDATTAAYPGFPERIDAHRQKGTAVLAGSELRVAWHDGRTETDRRRRQRRRHRRRPDGLPARLATAP